MTIRPIISLPDPRLRQISAPVDDFGASLQTLVDDMFDTMYDAPGVGLAAIQIAVPQRVVTIDIAKKDMPPEPLVLINPEIVWASDERNVHEEGCLSIADYYEEVERPARVRVRFRDRHGAPHEIEAEGLLATCVQHEVDHLNGLLFIDHISRLKRDRVTKKFIKAARQELHTHESEEA